MGLLLSLIGLEIVDLVAPDARTYVKLGDVTGHQGWFALAGLILISVLLYHNVTGAIVLGIAAVSVVEWMYTPGSAPSPSAGGIVALPSLAHTSFQLNFQALRWFHVVPTFGFLFAAVFDISGVMYGMSKMAGLSSDRHPHVPGSEWGFFASSLSTCVAACLGCSPVVVYVESGAGIQKGARTGLSSLVAACFFLVAIWFAPLLASIPQVGFFWVLEQDL